MFKLNRADGSDFTRLSEMIRNLEKFLNSKFEFDSKDWNEQLDLIVNHQSGDGSFRIVDTLHIEADAFFSFCNYPTVLCNAIMIKAVLLCPEKYESLLPALSMGLQASAKMGLEGHGYDALDGLFDCITIYSKSGLLFFLEKYPEIAPKFTECIKAISDFIATCIKEKSFVHGFNVNYEMKIRITDLNLTHKPVFTYGTLMEGERNHHFMDEQPLPDDASIYGYNLFNLGSFPGIRPSIHKDRTVKGEVYLVGNAALSQINILENEGSLYKMRYVEAWIGDISQIAGVYVYNRKAPKNARIESGDWRAR